MKPALTWLAFGLLAVIVQGALTRGLPIQWVPDFALLVPVVGALVLGPLEGLLLSVLVGLGGDLLSGSLLGQQASLRIVEFALTKFVSAQIDLHRTAPLLVYVFALTLADGAAMSALSLVFLGDWMLRPQHLGMLLVRGAVGAAIAPLLRDLAVGIVERVSESEARHEMRLDTKRPVL